MIFQLILAALLGGCIGLEREYRHKPAGFRTYLLVSLGSALFTILSRQLLNFAGGPGIDPTRIAAQVVTGIGFIGAGAIIRGGREGIIAGLTTAATIWAVAGIGLAAGAGLYLVAVVATLLILLVLIIPHPRVS